MKATKKSFAPDVFVYEDSDHGDIEVFSSLKKAIAYAEKQWPISDDFDEERWEEVSDGLHDVYSDYISIHFKQIK